MKCLRNSSSNFRGIFTIQNLARKTTQKVSLCFDVNIPGELIERSMEFHFEIYRGTWNFVRVYDRVK